MEMYSKHIIVFSQIGIGLLIFGVYTVVLVFLVGKLNADIEKISKQSARSILSLKEEYIQKLIYFQEEDRKRLSEELHDNIMSRFQLMRLNLFDGNIELLKKNLKYTMKIVRALSHNFAPLEANTNELPLVLEDYIVQIENRLQIDYYVVKSQKAPALSSKVKLTVFRIFQELISNILKHANATKVDVQLRCTLHSTTLLVKDNGNGFDFKAVSEGIGLKNIKYRAKMIKSKYKFKTNLGKYTMFIIFIPQYNQESYE